MIKNPISIINKPLFWASFLVMLDSLSFSLVMPVMPDLLMDMGCTSVSEAAFYGGMLTAAFALLQFIFGPWIGNLSDRFGRRPILLVSLAVLFVDYLIKGCAHSLWLLLVGRIICGIGLANYSTASAIIADVSESKHKAANFGLLGTALGFGFILGALVSSLLSSFGSRMPLYVAAVLAIANLIFGFIFIKETLVPIKRRRFYWRRANPLGAFRVTFLVPSLRRMLLVVFFYEIAFNVYQATWAYFTKEKFGWNIDTIGISLGFFGVTTALMQAFGIRFFLKRFGEYTTALFALIINAVVFLLYAYAPSSWMIFALIPLSALGTIFVPAMQSILSRRVKEDCQGELQGMVTSVRAISITIGPLLMTGIFSAANTASIMFPGAAFLVAMMISLLSFMIFLRVHQTKYESLNTTSAI